MKDFIRSGKFKILVAFLSLALVAPLCPDFGDETAVPQVEEPEAAPTEAIPAAQEQQGQTGADAQEQTGAEEPAVARASSGVEPSKGDQSVPMPDGPEVTIAFINKSDLDICRIWVTPTAEPSWGAAIELSKPLSSGSSYSVTGLPAGYYDIKVEDCAGNVLAWNQGIDVPESGVPVEADVAVPVAVASFRNDLQDDICAVYMTRVEDFAQDGWRRNLISSSNRFVPSQIRYLKAGEGDWNFRVETCGGDVYEGSNLSLTTGDNIFDVSALEW